MSISIYAEEFCKITILILRDESLTYRFVIPGLEDKIVCDRPFLDDYVCLLQARQVVTTYLSFAERSREILNILVPVFDYKRKRFTINPCPNGFYFEVIGYQHIFKSADNFKTELEARRAAEFAIDAHEIIDTPPGFDELTATLNARLETAKQELRKITLKTDVKQAIKGMKNRALANQKKAEVFSISKTFTKEEFLMMTETVLNVSFPASRLPFIVLAKCDYTQIVSEHPEGFVQRLMSLTLTDLDYLTEVLRKYWMYNVFLTFEERLESLGLHWDE